MVYKILLNLRPTFNAPETVNVNDFEEIGTIEAFSKVWAYTMIDMVCKLGIKEVISRGYKPNLDLDAGVNFRNLTPGDLLVDSNNVAYILTPQLGWSIVKVHA